LLYCYFIDVYVVICLFRQGQRFAQAGKKDLRQTADFSGKSRYCEHTAAEHT